MSDAVVEKKTYDEQLQDLVEDYRASGEDWPAPSKVIAGWLIRTGRWRAPRKNEIDILAPQLSAAMRHELFTDPQGRRVRKKHSIRRMIELEDGTHKQTALWADFDDISRDDMHVSLQQRRGQVLGDCVHLKTDLDSYNENRNPGPNIQMSFDFTDDVLELSQPDEYDGIDG
jgi:hypothetical protein